MWCRVLLGVGLILSPVLYCVAWIRTLFPWLRGNDMSTFIDSIMHENGSEVLKELHENCGKYLPTIYKEFMVERDTWMAVKLIQTCHGFVSKNDTFQRVPTSSNKPLLRWWV
jgi:hypothetical protein